MKRIVTAAGTSACVLTLLTATAAHAADPKACEVGVYVISLHDFNMTTASFGADLWVWSTCPSRELRPLEVMDFPTAVRVDTRLESTLERNGVWWSYLKVSGVFRQHWDVRRYPFDRHVLRITMENTNAPASEFSYRADRRGSRLGRDIGVDGWQVANFEIRAHTYVYDTTFGDPAFAGKEQSDYSRLEMSVSISRTKRWSFVTLVAGVYVAFALSCLTFLLGPYNGRRRTNLIAGTLFAVVVNQRVADSVIGRTEHITFLDQIHLVGMIAIFAIAVASIHAQRVFDRGEQERAARFDITGLWVATIWYVAVNMCLVWLAATS